MDIRAISIAEFFDDPATKGLMAEYARESSIQGMPPITPHQPSYEGLERSGTLRMLAAFDDGQMIGFVTVLVYFNPHYSQRMAVTESLFVASAARRTGAGMLLLHAAELDAFNREAVGLLVSAPVGGRLAGVLDAKDTWRETNRVFFKGLA